MKKIIFSKGIPLLFGVLFYLMPKVAYSQLGNIAPLATVTAAGGGAAGCQTGPCSTVNDLNLGSCGSQQMWINTGGTPSTTPGVDWIQFDFPSVQAFDTLIIHHGSATTRFLTGATVQYWDGTSWVTHMSFSGLPQQCINRVPIGVLSTDRFRITAFIPGTGQLSNQNFREIEVIAASTGANDAAITRLDSPNVFCAGTENIVVTVANLGITQIDSVDIDWEFNGIPQTGLRYIGLLDTNNGANPTNAQVVLGSKNFPAGSNYSIKAWTSNPNGMADTTNLNDTLNRNIGPALQGTFTVNSALPASATNFQSLTDMTAALNNYGVCGPVTVNVAAGVYNEEVELGDIVGSSSVNTITIDGGDSSTTSILHNGSGNIATVTLDGTDWTTIKNLTIEATGTTGVAVLFTGSNESCIISNNVLRVNTASTSSLATNVTFSGSKTSPTTTVSAGYNNNVIANNKMRGGYYGVRLYGPTSGTTVVCSGNKVIGNDIDSIYYYGVYAYYQDGVEIIGNRIIQTNRGNAFGDGIYMYTNNNGKINGNYVHADDYGMYWSNSNTRVGSLTRSNEVINNMVISTNDFAAYLYSVDSVNFWFNSMTNTGSSPVLYIAGSTAYPFSDWDLRNNIFSATGGGAALDLTISDTIFNKMDNNDYHTTGATLLDINNTTYANLPSYQTAQPLLNNSSLEGDPQFLSGTDLHIIGGFVNDSGDATVPVFVDIDGDTRPRTGALSVDIGADEFDPPTCLPATNLAVYNVGLNSATLTWDASAVGATYEYVVVPAGTPQSSGTPVASATDSVVAGGLSASSAYEFYVRVVCGRGDTSLWIGPASFNTANGIPYWQDFENYTSGLQGNTFPEGWSQRPGTASYNMWRSQLANGNNTNSSGTGPLWDHTFFGGPTGGMYMYMETSTSNTGDTVELYSPPIFVDSILNVVELGYWYFNYGSNIDKMEVLADTNGVRNLLATYTGQQQTAQSDPWLFDSHFLNGYNGKSVTIVFRGYGVPCCSGDIAVDDISLDPVLPLDAGVTDVVSPSGSLCPGPTTPIVEVRNFGSAQMDSVKVYWDINGVLDSLTYIGTVAPGATVNVSLASINILSTQVYNVVFYTGDINGQADQFSGNDSLSLNGLRTGIAGTVTLDPSQAASATNFIDFATLTATLNNYGVCGSAVVNVANGVYNGAIQFGDIPGASAMNTLTIDGGDSSLTYLVHDGSGGNIATLALNRTDWITVKNMTIEATGTSGASVIFMGGNDHCTISNNVLRVNTASTSSLATNVSFSNSTTSPTTTITVPCTYNTIANNKMRGGYYAVRMYGPTAAPLSSIGNSVVGNDIDSAYYYGIYSYYVDSTHILNNRIDLNSRGNTFADGIYMYANENGKINGNYVYTGDYGIYWSNSNTSMNPQTQSNEIINNMVISNTDFAIYTYSVDSLNFWYNSLNALGSSPAYYLAGSTAYPISGYDMRNNILSAAGGGIALDMATYGTGIFNKMDNNTYYTTGTILIDDNNTTYANLPSYQTAFPLLNTSSLEGDPQFLTATDLHVIGAFVNDSGDATVPVAVDIDGDVRPSPNGTGVDMGADEFDPPTCPPAYNLAATNPSLDSVTLQWAAASAGVSFEYVYVTGGSPIGSGNPVITTMDSIRIGGLTASTRYEFYVRVICGRGDTSIWMGPLSFNTANGVPYMQDFQAWAGNTTGLIQEEGWYTLGTPTPHWEVGQSTSSSGTGPVADHTIGSGGTFVYLETSGGSTGNTDTLWSAPVYFSPSQDTVQMKYWYHMYGSAMGTLEVYALANGVMSPLLSTWIGQQQTTQAAAWLPDSATLVGYNGSTVQLVFVGIRGTSFTSDMSIDDVSLMPNIAVGIDDQTADAGPQFRLTPNPSNGEFMINIKTEKVEQMQLTIRNVNGQIVHDEQINVNRFYNKRMDVSHLSKGMYFLRLQNDDEARVEKIVIQ